MKQLKKEAIERIEKDWNEKMGIVTGLNYRIVSQSR